MTERESILCIGNDFNDEEMLKWAQHSCVVSNSPSPLKEKFFALEKSNDENGFSLAVSKWFNGQFPSFHQHPD